MEFKELNTRVLKWAENKGILSNTTPLKQLMKTKEEVDELQEAIFAQKNNIEYFVNSKDLVSKTSIELEDAIGDVFVTLLIQCELQNLEPLKCLNTALNVIENRKGIMVDGVFVKK